MWMSLGVSVKKNFFFFLPSVVFVFVFVFLFFWFVFCFFLVFCLFFVVVVVGFWALSNCIHEASKRSEAYPLTFPVL